MYLAYPSKQFQFQSSTVARWVDRPEFVDSNLYLQSVKIPLNIEFVDCGYGCNSSVFG